MAELAGQKIDADDFQRQLEQARDIPITEELRLLIGGVLAGEGTNRVEARTAMNVAKENALRKARRALIRQIEAANTRMRDKRLLPVAAADVRAWIADGGAVKVQA